MIFVITLISIVCFIFLCILNRGIWYNNIVAFLSVFGMIIFGVAAAIMLIIIITVNINSKADKAAFEKHYESLVYQLENDLYDNDNDIGKKELYDQITRWNYDLARRKELSKNIWVGIFWADIYDDFEFIELDGGKE